MAESIQLTNLQLQDDILKNLLLGLQKQSQFYVLKINETGEMNEDRKNFEKELSDINKVLTELSSKALSYTVQELDNLRTQFNDKLIQLNSVITDLEINTLKIEFNSLTPEQKEFLRGAKGDKGDKGDNLYVFAQMFGFLGTETEFLDSLKGANGQNGVNGQDGQSLTFDMLTLEQKASLKGDDGQDGQSLTFDMLTPEQKASLKGADGQSLTFDMLTPEQIASLKGADGQNGVNGQDGQSLTFDMLTPEQKASLKGADGQSLTFDMLTPEQIASLKGADGQNGQNGVNGQDGQSLTFDMLTVEQKQSFIDSFLVTTQMQDILRRLSDLENSIPVANLPFLNKEVQLTEVENSGLTYFIKTNYQIKENDIITITATFPSYDFLIQYKVLPVGASFEFELLIDPYIDNYYSLSTELLPLTDGTLLIIPYISNNQGASFITDYVFGVSIEEVTESIEPLDFTIINDSSFPDTWVINEL